VTGTVYLVGAGPGAADLLTLRALRVLGQADIVFHDALVSEEILSLCSKAEKIKVGKRSGRHSTAQHFINKQLADAAYKHEVVVRLKGGDPMLFGRAHEEISHLRQKGIPVQVVPGVTAALAAAAELQASLTRRGLSRSIAFLTPRAAPGEPSNDWVKVALAADTVAIYMGAGEAESISRDLIDAGKPASTPVAVIENASLPDANARFGTLESLPEIAKPGGPSLILLGEVLDDAAIIRAWQAAQSSFSPTAPVIPIGRGRSGSSR
jgi:uroporphyrin-III C-methyltransferase